MLEKNEKTGSTRFLERAVNPEWVVDKELWQRAKDAAQASENDPFYLSVVTSLYKLWGGQIRKPKSEPEAEQKAMDIVTQNPSISAATLLNTMKAEGLGVVDKTEADSGSTMVPSLRKENKTSMNIMACRFLEASPSDNGIGFIVFKVVLLQEGMGNYRDGFYYSRSALESAVPVFEGKKIFADHPDAQEEQTRPERSVRDVLGYFEGVHIEEDKKDGRAMLCADVRMMDEQQYAWARGLMRYAVQFSKKFPDKDFVGLSINASGDAETYSLEEFLKDPRIPKSAKPKLIDARDNGRDLIRVVNRISEAVSCDLVTEAGAGGRILEMIEQEKNLMAKKKTSKGTEIEETKVVEAKDDGGEKHDDAAQDVELIKQMIKKYAKSDADADEADMSMAKEMYHAAKELGYEGEDCERAAGMAMAIAKHRSKKKAETMKKEAEAKEAAAKVEETKPAEGAAAAEAKTKESAVEEKKDEATPEAAEGAKATEEKPEAGKLKEADGGDPRDAKIIELTARNGALEAELKDIKLGAYLDRKCKESGLPNSLTTKFKEALGKPKSEKHIDDQLKIFAEFADLARKESSTGFILGTEKQVGGDSRKADFSDCMRE